MDRLDAEEILETFKLIDRNASFPNTIFVTAYDKGYLNQVLTKHLGADSRGQCYADKYTTWEYLLTEHVEEKLTEIMDKLLASKVDDGRFIKRGDILWGWRRVAPTVVPLLGSVRHLKRYLNSFIDRYRERIDEVDPGDFFLVSLLRYLDMDTYLTLAKERPIKTGLIRSDEGIDPNESPKLNLAKRLIPEDQRENKQATIRILDSLFPKGTELPSYTFLGLDNPIGEGLGLGMAWHKCTPSTYDYYFSPHLDHLFSAKSMVSLLQQMEPFSNSHKPSLGHLYRRHKERIESWISYLSSGGVRDQQELMQLMQLCASTPEWQVYLDYIAKEPLATKLLRPLDMVLPEYQRMLKNSFEKLIPQYPLAVRKFSFVNLNKTEKCLLTPQELEELFWVSLQKLYDGADTADFDYDQELLFATRLCYAHNASLYPHFFQIFAPLVRKHQKEFAEVAFSVSTDHWEDGMELTFKDLTPILDATEEKDLDAWIESIPDKQLRKILLYIREHMDTVYGFTRVPYLPNMPYYESDKVNYVYHAILAYEERQSQQAEE